MNCFSVMVLRELKNGSGAAKRKLWQPKIMPKYGKISGYRTLKIVIAKCFLVKKKLLRSYAQLQKKLLSL